LRGNSQSEVVPDKARNGATISNKERVKERWAEHFENVLYRDRVTGKDIQNNKQVCDAGFEGRFIF
jgi:hypothetical protein